MQVVVKSDGCTCEVWLRVMQGDDRLGTVADKEAMLDRGTTQPVTAGWREGTNMQQMGRRLPTCNSGEDNLRV